MIVENDVYGHFGEDKKWSHEIDKPLLTPFYVTDDAGEVWSIKAVEGGGLNVRKVEGEPVYTTQPSCNDVVIFASRDLPK